MRKTLFILSLLFSLPLWSQNDIALVAIQPRDEISLSGYFHRILKRNRIADTTAKQQINATVYQCLSSPVSDIDVDIIRELDMLQNNQLKTVNGTRKYFNKKRSSASYKNHEQMILNTTAADYLRLAGASSEAKYIVVLHDLKFSSSLLKRLFKSSSETISIAVDIYDKDLNPVHLETISKKVRIRSDVLKENLWQNFRLLGNDVLLLIEEVMKKEG